MSIVFHVSVTFILDAMDIADCLPYIHSPRLLPNRREESLKELSLGEWAPLQLLGALTLAKV